MSNHILIKHAICASLMLSISLSSMDQTSFATHIAKEQVLAGMSLALDNTNLENISLPLQTTPATASAIQVPAKKVVAAPKTTKKVSPYANIGISIAKDYVCVRKAPSTSGKIVGKLYHGSAATIKKKKDSWVKVSSGKISGYIKKEFLATGEAAEKLASKYKRKKVLIKTEALKVRDSQSTNSEILTMVEQGDSFIVLKESDDWIKIKTNGKTGFVSKKYVKVYSSFKKAVVASNKKSNSNSKSSYSSKGEAIAHYALQFVGNSYVWGGTSLTNGTDCSGLTQSVMSHFGIYIPRDSRSQSGAGQRISVSEAKAGDLIFYGHGGSINHVALCIGGGQVVSAANEALGIRVCSIGYRTPICARRFL